MGETSSESGNQEERRAPDGAKVTRRRFGSKVKDIAKGALLGAGAVEIAHDRRKIDELKEEILRLQQENAELKKSQSPSPVPPSFEITPPGGESDHTDPQMPDIQRRAGKKQNEV